MKWIVLSVSLLGIAMWWLSHESRERSTRQPPAAGEIRKRVDAPIAGPTRTTRDAPVSPRPAPPADSAPRATPPAASSGDVAEQRAHLQARFAAQGVDAAWASTAQQALREDLGRFTGDSVRFKDVECRSSLCRAELTPTSADAGRTFLETWLHQRTWTGPGFAAGDEATDGGAPTMVVFLGRPETALPYFE